MANRKPTWLEVAVSRVGLLNGTRALSWAYSWAVAREVLGHDPSAEEVAKWWNASERTTYREQAAFRKAFPELDSPAVIYATKEARETIAKHAAFGDKLDQWKQERHAKREISMITLGLGTARFPTS